MIARIVLVLIALTISNSFGIASANQEASSDFIVGTAWDVVSFENGFEKDDLHFIFGEPATPISDIPIVVVNLGNKPIENLRLRVTTEGDFGWYADSSVWIYPTRILRGDFGFGRVQLRPTSAPKTESGGDGKYHAYVLKPDQNMETFHDLHVLNAEYSPITAEITGELQNATLNDLTEIETYWLCVEDSGVVTSVHGELLDRRLLESGATGDFEVDLGHDCGEYFFFYAGGVERE